MIRISSSLVRALKQGSIGLLLFSLGFSTSVYLRNIQYKKDIATGQDIVLDYINEMETFDEFSQYLIQQSYKDEDGDTAPVINLYFDRLRDSK